MWLDKKECKYYQTSYDTLYYKTLEEVVVGFQQRYLNITQSVADGIIENPIVKDLPPQEIFIRWLSRDSLEQILYFGFHQALSSHDWRVFLNAQFTFNRLTYQHDTRAYLQNWSAFDGPFGLGTDRSGFWLQAIEALGACDKSLALAYLPKEDGFTTNGFEPMVCASNLLMCLMYPGIFPQSIALKKAEKILIKKSTNLMHKATLKYMMALIAADSSQASNALQDLINGFSKADVLHDYHHALSKCCPRYVYGLYFAAQLFKPEVFYNIQTPTHSLWLDEYVNFCKDNNYQCGNNAVPWRDEVAFLHNEFDDLNRWKTFPSFQRD